MLFVLVVCCFCSGNGDPSLFIESVFSTFSIHAAPTVLFSSWTSELPSLTFSSSTLSFSISSLSTIFSTGLSSFFALSTTLSIVLLSTVSFSVIWLDSSWSLLAFTISDIGVSVGLFSAVSFASSFPGTSFSSVLFSGVSLSGISLFCILSSGTLFSGVMLFGISFSGVMLSSTSPSCVLFSSILLSDVVSVSGASISSVWFSGSSFSRFSFSGVLLSVPSIPVPSGDIMSLGFTSSRVFVSFFSKESCLGLSASSLIITSLPPLTFSLVGSLTDDGWAFSCINSGLASSLAGPSSSRLPLSRADSSIPIEYNWLLKQ